MWNRKCPSVASGGCALPEGGVISLPIVFRLGMISQGIGGRQHVGEVGLTWALISMSAGASGVVVSRIGGGGF